MSDIQSCESELERLFIEKSVSQGYTYRKDIRNTQAVNENFKRHIEQKNETTLSEKEFAQILQQISGKSPFECAAILQDKVIIRRDNDQTSNLVIYDTKQWCRNHFEVINQLKDGKHRYDVLLLINGIPMVHIELKNSTVTPTRALEQIRHYKSHSQGDCELLSFVQIFIISNGSLTYYCVNNERKFFNIDVKKDVVPIFEWTDKENKPLNGLLSDFAPTFLEKCFLSEMIARYIVMIKTTKQLMILRPYQVYAVKAIINQIQYSSKTHGYIWHTTGSGKTLTSFKTATILRDQEDIDKIIFVVDRKDLDKQTIQEFNRFEEKCVDLTKNSGQLKEKLLDSSQKLIVTTIQKMSRLLKNEAATIKDIKNKRVIMIFDECHRSQFGDYNARIRESFKNLQMFGFTGTPIFPVNSKKMLITGNQQQKMETEHIFEKCLHRYLIADAIKDRNVLQFHIDYYEPQENVNHESPRWKRLVAEKIVETHKSATVGRQYNAIFATSKIVDAIEYFKIFKDLQKDLPENDRLHIASIFSPPPNMNLVDKLHEDLEDENAEYKSDGAEGTKKEALEMIIRDYNQLFGVGYDLSADETKGFMGYHGDISARIKDHHVLRTSKKIGQTIDILIVVDMFLTGFDSKFINTLYVDKKLEYHGLIQAYSRTNRLHNANKPFGNIYNFRRLKANVDEAIQIFSFKDHARSNVWIVPEFAQEKAKLETQLKELARIFEAENLCYSPVSAPKLSDDTKTEFFREFQEVIKTRKALEQYIFEDQSAVEKIYPKHEFNAMTCVYLQLLQKSQTKNPAEEKDDEDTEDSQLDLELELLHRDVVDVEYIKNLTIEYVQKNCEKGIESFLGEIQQDVVGVRESEFVKEFIEYCCTQKDLAGKSRREIEQAYTDFKEAKEINAWKALCEEEGLELDKLWDMRKAYVHRGDWLDKASKISDLISGNMGVIQRIERQDCLEKKIDAIVDLYLCEDGE